MLLAGRYEGVDERLIESEIDESVSIGDYVLSGGELPALVLIDAVVRLLPGVLGDDESAQQDSFVDRAARLAALHAAGSVRRARGAAVLVERQPRRDPALARRSRRWGARGCGGPTCSRS